MHSRRVAIIAQEGSAPRASYGAVRLGEPDVLHMQAMAACAHEDAACCDSAGSKGLMHLWLVGCKLLDASDSGRTMTMCMCSESGLSMHLNHAPEI